MKSKMKKAPFRAWLDRQPSTDPVKAAKGEKMTIPEFVDLAIARGVKTAKANSLYKAARGAVPRNRVLYEEAIPGVKF